MLITDLKYSYNDVAIVPNCSSLISHRSECIPHDDNGFLPLFTAPMSSVVDNLNFDEFKKNKIYPIIPRNISFDERMKLFLNNEWVAFSLKEFEDIFCKENTLSFQNGRVLVDIANGHMEKLFSLVKDCKKIHKNNIKVMIGNIANPLTYEKVFKCGADYVRLGIGSGRGCITSSNTGIHYPMASLINDTVQMKKKLVDKYDVDFNSLPKIVADGGIRNYSDIIKAIALGADYVMCGYIFSKMYESAGEKSINTDNENARLILETIDKTSSSEEEKKQLLSKSGCIKKKFYGMSTKKAQLEINKFTTLLKTSEGKEEEINIEYTMNGWVENFIHYITSAMSYCNSKSIQDFQKNATLCLISNNTYHSVNK